MRVFVTGATGFIGSRLISSLLQEGHEVYALVRSKKGPPFSKEYENLHILWGDLQNPDALDTLPDTLDVAFYLMHSMSDRTRNLLDVECRIAQNFVHALKKRQVGQIIYLSGIIDHTSVSPHLKSRLAVEGILKSSGIPTTILRASIIIGKASASFQIIRDLVEKLPIMVAPRWVGSLCQPIAVCDVIYYLQHVMLKKECFDKTFDIGGPDVLSFKEALLGYAKFRKLKRYIISIPLLTPRLSSYWLVFVTAVSYSLAAYLVESMRSNSICRDASIQAIIPHICLSYEQALERTLALVSDGVASP